MENTLQSQIAEFKKLLSINQPAANSKLVKEFVEQSGYVVLGSHIEGQIDLCAAMLKSFVYGDTKDFTESDAWALINSLELTRKLIPSIELELLDKIKELEE